MQPSFSLLPSDEKSLCLLTLRELCVLLFPSLSGDKMRNALTSGNGTCKASGILVVQGTLISRIVPGHPGRILEFFRRLINLFPCSKVEGLAEFNPK